MGDTGGTAILDDDAYMDKDSKNVNIACSPVNCLRTYSAWGPCSVTCGGGAGTSTRSVTSYTAATCGGTCDAEVTSAACTSITPCVCSTPPLTTGGVCTGNSQCASGSGTCQGGICSCNDWNSCTTDVCPASGICSNTNVPVNGSWTYSAWGACSLTCGGGTQTRTALSCPASCGGTCPAAVTSQACNTQLCACNAVCTGSNQCAFGSGTCQLGICSCNDGNSCTTDVCPASGNCSNTNTYNWNTTYAPCTKSCGIDATRTPIQTCTNAVPITDGTGTCCVAPKPSTDPVACSLVPCICNEGCSINGDCANAGSGIEKYLCYDTGGGVKKCRRNGCKDDPSCPAPGGTWAPCAWGPCEGAAEGLVLNIVIQ